MTSLSSHSSLVDGLSLCGEVVWPLTTGVSLQSLLTAEACLLSPLIVGAELQSPLMAEV